MTRPVICALIALSSACGSGEPKANTAGLADSAVTAPAIAQPAPNPLPTMTGSWAMHVLDDKGDSLAYYTLVATADSSAWSMNFPGRQPIPLRVVGTRGDSVMTEAGPYSSVLRPGVSVTTNFVGRVRGDSFVGSWVAHYRSKGADSVRRGRNEGVRAR